MTVLEAVKRSNTTQMMFKDAINAAQKALTETETLLWANTGNVTLDDTLGGSEKGLKPGVIAVTSHRLLFVYGVLDRSFTRQLLLPDIQSTQSKPGHAFASVHIRGAEGAMIIESNPKTISKLIAVLDSAMSAAGEMHAAEFSPFRTASATDAAIAQSRKTAPEDIDLEPYFQKYYPSRTKAAKALARDTDLPLAQCKPLIDTYFSTNLARVPMPKANTSPDLKHLLTPEKAAREDRMKALDQQGIAYCPKCASTSITAGKRGFSIGKSLAGSLISPKAGLFAGAIGANKIRCVCLKCGHSWMP